MLEQGCGRRQSLQVRRGELPGQHLRELLGRSFSLVAQFIPPGCGQ
jgi:hypothetical protein